MNGRVAQNAEAGLWRKKELLRGNDLSLLFFCVIVCFNNLILKTTLRFRARGPDRQIDNAIMEGMKTVLCNEFRCISNRKQRA